MLLSLRPTDTAQRPACAALLRGADPAAWLRELSRWEVPASRLRCYLVPESLASVAPAGLLVEVVGGTPPPDVPEPYGLEAGRLYVPTHAALWPATTPAELAGALLWPRQLLHPGSGLVGFDDADELPLADLLCLPLPRPTDWSAARPEPPAPPPLHQLRVAAPSTADVMQQLQADVAAAPLAALPGLADSRPGWPRRLAGWLQRALLRGALALARLGGGGRISRPTLPRWVAVVGGGLAVLLALVLLGHLLAGKGAPTGAGVLITLVVLLIRRLLTNDEYPDYEAEARPAHTHPRPAGGPGWLGRAQDWLNQRLADLEKQRQTELAQLLQLFKDNPAEALRYAIPLSSPYLSRGTAAPTGRLSRDGLFDFSLGRLGGGRATDVWDVGPFEDDLRRQYLAAAQHELDAGRHRQAAYIQAHLLGDYRAAALTLEQGGYFREAAALHRDHLRNLPAAAQCLERGHLLLEAADLYAELGQTEKAGDLHQQLGQPAPAARYYEQASATLLGNHDYLEAARVQADKLRDPARAQATLLHAWDDNRQAEACLGRYLDLAATRPAADLGATVRYLHEAHTPPARQGALLQVLGEAVGRHPTALPAAREVAYAVLADEAATGTLTHLPLLRRFVPADALLPGDLSRFAGRQPRRPAPVATPAPPALNATVEWRVAVVCGAQWLAVGVRDNHLHLARGNWYGQVEYYSWPVPLPAAGGAVLLQTDEQQGALVLLRTSVPLALEPKVLPRNKYFAQELRVESPRWLPPWSTRMALLPINQFVASAQHVGATIVVQHHRPDGGVLTTHTYPVAGLDPAAPERPWRPGELLWHNNQLYGYWGSQLVRLGHDGSHHATRLPAEAWHLTRSPYWAGLLLAIATTDDLLLWQPTDGTQAAANLRVAFDASHHLCFVGPAHLVAANEREVVLFHFTRAELREVRRLPAADVVAVLPTSHHRQFALLAANGRLTLHRLDDE